MQTGYEIAKNIEENREQVKANFFPTGRGLRHKDEELPEKYRVSYTDVFTKAFFNDVGRLKRDQVWLNVGGGELYAEAERITLPDFAGREIPTICTVSVENPQGQKKKAFKENYDIISSRLRRRFLYLSGQRIEEIPVSALPKANVVSDLWGATGFSERIDETVQRELDQLKLGGRLYTTIEQVFIGNMRGRQIGIREYLGMIKGVDVHYFENKFSALMMTKTMQDVEVPRLQLVEFHSYKNQPVPPGWTITMVNCKRYYVMEEKTLYTPFQ